jgi:hypothetical protein
MLGFVGTPIGRWSGPVTRGQHWTVSAPGLLHLALEGGEAPIGLDDLFALTA